MTTDKIYLVGFMGAGKSTVARVLARRLDWQPVDVDALIEAREQRDIPGIFRRDGEAYFRAVERQVLADLLAQRGVVVATGGGTCADPASRTLMLRDGLVVWLDVPFPRVLDRVPLDGRRPLAADRQKMEALYTARRPAYQQSHVRVDAGRSPVDAVVEQILEHLRP